MLIRWIKHSEQRAANYTIVSCYIYVNKYIYIYILYIIYIYILNNINYKYIYIVYILYIIYNI